MQIREGLFQVVVEGRQYLMIILGRILIRNRSELDGA